MGFIILLAVICIICAVSVFVYCVFDIKIVDQIMDCIFEWLVTIGFIAACTLGISILIAIVNNAGYDAFVAENQQVYDILVYQFENDLYDNDNDLGKKELYDQIREWNTDLASGKAWTHNPWFGIFWTDAYDEFEFIELE